MRQRLMSESRGLGRWIGGAAAACRAGTNSQRLQQDMANTASSTPLAARPPPDSLKKKMQL
jgi:hypothetical protein